MRNKLLYSILSLLLLSCTQTSQKAFVVRAENGDIYTVFHEAENPIKIGDTIGIEFLLGRVAKDTTGKPKAVVINRY